MHLKRVMGPKDAYSIQVPKDAETRILGDQLTVNVNPAGRENREFTLASRPPETFQPQKLNLNRELENGAFIRWRTWTESGGSSGEILRMEGKITLKNSTWYVSSIWQEEVLFFDGSRKRKVDFALIYLATMERVNSEK